jgi:glycosyltransferase involved in cell wall biosynthesis
MAVFNGEKYIKAAIESVLAQTYANWELLVINDGSTDATAELIGQICDSRLRYFVQDNCGVSSARNVGLRNMVGCFLDADDLLTPDSILVRLTKFHQDATLDFVDGSVLFFTGEYQFVRKYNPWFTGRPLLQLFLLNGSCFAGLTWMVRRQRRFRYVMDEELSHGEDLLFCMQLARQGGKYAYVENEIYLYRQHPASSMQNPVALEEGYWYLYSQLKEWSEFTWRYRVVFLWRVKKFMMLEYLSRGLYWRALFVLRK